MWATLEFGSFMATPVFPSRAPVILLELLIPDEIVSSVRNSVVPYFTVTLPQSTSLEAMWLCSRDSTLLSM